MSKLSDKSVKKVVYFSNPNFLDYDLSLIKNLSREVDLYYFLDISPVSSRSTLLEIKNYHDKTGVFRSSIYKELGIINNYINNEKIFVINRKTNKPCFSNIRLQFVLAKLLKDISPDIIHYNTEFNFNYFLLSAKIKIPFVCTIHDPILHSDVNIIKETTKRKFSFKLTKNFIILNQTQKDEFILKYGLQSKNVFVSSMSIYEFLRENFHAILNSNVRNPKKAILFFGRINKYKGIDYLIDAFRIVNKKHPDTRLIIAGKGRMIAENNLPANVTLINRYISNDELFTLIKESQFVVCPYTDATQSGVIMTAFSFAKPVIATNVGGLKEYVEHLKTGLMVDPKNSEALAEAILTVINDTDLLDRMTKNIEKIYHNGGTRSWKSIAENTINIYNELG